MSTLIEKNKVIGSQISTFYKKSLSFFEKIKQHEINNFLKSSGEEKEKKSSE